MEYPTDKYYKKIGKIVQTQGLDGYVVLAHEFATSRGILSLKHLFIELHPHSYIPFFPEEAPKEIESGKILLLLDDIQTIEQARELTGKSVFIEKELYKKRFPKTSALDENLAGFRVIDQNTGNEALIQSVFSSGGQLLAEVNFKEKEIFLPLNEAFLIDVNEEAKTIRLNLPDGIWELD